MLAQLEPYARNDFVLEQNFAGHRKASKSATIQLLGFGNWACYTPLMSATRRVEKRLFSKGLDAAWTRMHNVAARRPGFYITVNSITITDARSRS